MTSAASKRRSWLPSDGRSCFFLALLVALAFLLFSISRSGIWDPYELERVELARRIAIHLFGSEELVLAGANNSMPTLTDLGAGELAFTSMALGLSQLGLHDWAGRLPLALWGLAGALVLYGFLARMVSPRAGLYGVVALCTMPLYFIQARTMLGDIVTMAAFTFCFCGFVGALLDEGSIGVRAAWLLLGGLGVVTGYLSRGLLIGVAAPLLGVGLSWLVLVCGPLRREVLPTPEHPPAKGVLDPLAHLGAWLGAPGRRQLTSLIGVGALCCGLAALYLGVNALLAHAWDRSQLMRVLGVAMVRKAPLEATFDLTVRDLGHALFPWSALLPFAVGRLFTVPAPDEAKLPPGDASRPAARTRSLGVRVCLLVGAACAYAAHALMAPYVGGLPFVAPALLAAIVAIVVHDFERGAPPSGVLGVGTLLLAFVLLRDMLKIPVKSLSPFSVAERSFPSGFEATSATIMRIATVLFCSMVLLSWLDRDDDGELGTMAALSKWGKRRYEAYREALHALQELWKGNLVFGFLVVEAALVGLGAMLLVGRHYGWANVVRLPQRQALIGLNLWWAVPLAIALTPLLLDGARAMFKLLMGALRLPRAFGTTVGALGCGALLCFGFYPALAAQLSPKEVFQSYAKKRGSNAPLGLLGLKKRVARYYANGGEVVALSSTHTTFGWLTSKSSPKKLGPRRWLALRRKDLAELNAMWRGTLGSNLPVLDARSSQILLASNQLGTGKNHNPLGKYLLDAKPNPIQHPVNARFDDKLEVLGWEVRDESGRLVDAVIASAPYRMRLFYRVLKPITRNYRAFIHIDGAQRRHNGDHEVLEKAYPMTLWRPGDIVADPYKLVLEPNFTPDRYVVFFGFFMGKQRFAVSHGRHNGNRVNGGHLVVR